MRTDASITLRRISSPRACSLLRTSWCRTTRSRSQRSGHVQGLYVRVQGLDRTRNVLDTLLWLRCFKSARVSDLDRTWKMSDIRLRLLCLQASMASGAVLPRLFRSVNALVSLWMPSACAVQAVQTPSAADKGVNTDELFLREPVRFHLVHKQS